MVNLTYAPEARGLHRRHQSCLSHFDNTWLFLMSSSLTRSLLKVLFLSASIFFATSDHAQASSGKSYYLPLADNFGLATWVQASKPSFDLDRLGGNRGQLGQYGNNIVIVHFFATWCENCRDELISLQAITDHFVDFPVIVLAIDVADLDMRAKRYFDLNKVSYPVFLDRDRATAKAWGVYSLPTTFILDKSLAAKYRAESIVDWRSQDLLNFIRTLATQ